MLYVTTRNNRDPYTAYRTMHTLRSPDGGFFLPFRHPKFTQQELDGLTRSGFGDCVALVLNRLFNTRLNGWDIDSCCGRSPVRIKPLPHRILIAEGWHNPTGSFAHVIKAVTQRFSPEVTDTSDWINIAIRAAVLFGVFGELQRNGIHQADISVLSGDFLLPISAWYARRWGLPIGNIICCCNENNSIWELLCHGQMRTDAVSLSTNLPEADVSVPAELERLIYEAGGMAEAKNYVTCVRTGRAYYPGDSILSRLRSGMYASVVSSHRLETTIPSVYRTHGYLMTPATALSYAGLLDYRARTGESCPVLVWSEESPSIQVDSIARFLNISADELQY